MAKSLNNSNSAQAIPFSPYYISFVSRAVAARENSLNSPPPIPGSGQASKSKPPPQLPRPVPKKDVKKSLKGVVVKKKAKPTPVPSSEQSKSDANGGPSENTDSQPAAKRRKVSEVSS